LVLKVDEQIIKYRKIIESMENVLKENKILPKEIRNIKEE
jgi:hypothetical protein